MASKARDLSNFISVATIDASEIASSAITTDKIADVAVTHAKLHTDMNLSGKSLTFAADQISGNAIDGGVISNFTSTGIDDNATSTAVTILSNGNVGVGTASPVSAKSEKTLQVLGNIKVGSVDGRGLLSLGDTASGNVNVGIWRGAPGAYAGIGNSLNLGGYDAITFTVGNSDIATQTERMRIDGNGNVVIGSDVANGRFSITPANNPTTLATSTTLTLNETTNNAAYQLRMAYSLLSGAYKGVIDAVQNNLGAPLAINPTGGNVGIGTTSPSAKLEVVGSANAATFKAASAMYQAQLKVIDTTALAANTGGKISFMGVYTSGGGETEYGQIQGIKENATDGNFAGALAFYSRANAANPAERMRIDSSGNVGIGTSSPTHKLTVGGYSNVNAANKLAIGDNAGYQALIYMESANETLTIENTSDYAGRATIFKDNGTERMRIDSAGRVTMPYQPLIYLDGKAGTGTIPGSGIMLTFDVEIQKGGMLWNAANGRITVPVAGYYRIDLKTYHYSSTCRTGIYINSAERSLAHSAGATADQTRMQYVIALLAANDYIHFYHDAQIYTGPNHTQASCYLLG